MSAGCNFKVVRNGFFTNPKMMINGTSRGICDSCKMNLYARLPSCRETAFPGGSL